MIGDKTAKVQRFERRELGKLSSLFPGIKTNKALLRKLFLSQTKGM